MGDYDYRSKSTAFDRHDMQIQPYTGQYPARSYSTPRDINNVVDMNNKSGKSSKSGKNWGFSDPEFQRKKRVASYKSYAAEGRVKGSFRNSFRWLKDKYTKVVYGWW